MFIAAFPLLLIPFAIYNMLVYLTPGISLTEPLFSLNMLSGATMNVSISDLLLIFSVLLLFVEVLKAARPALRSVVDHILSLLLFIAMVIEFILSDRAATSTFLLITVISFVDVIAGFSVSIRTAQRDIAIDSPDRLS